MFPHLDRNANIDVIREEILGSLSKVFLQVSVKIAQLLSGDTTFWFGALQSLHRSGLSYEPVILGLVALVSGSCENMRWH